MIQLLVDEDSSVLKHADVAHNTPLRLFLSCRNLLGVGQRSHDNDSGDNVSDEELSLQNLLERGIKCQELDCLFIFNKFDLSRIDSKTGLTPFLLAASFPQCDLDSVYMLAMKNPDLLANIS